MNEFNPRGRRNPRAAHVTIATRPCHVYSSLVIHYFFHLHHSAIASTFSQEDTWLLVEHRGRANQPAKSQTCFYSTCSSSWWASHPLPSTISPCRPRSSASLTSRSPSDIHVVRAASRQSCFGGRRKQASGCGYIHILLTSNAFVGATTVRSLRALLRHRQSAFCPNQRFNASLLLYFLKPGRMQCIWWQLPIVTHHLRI